VPLLAIALSILPFLYLVSLCRHMHVDVPFGDQFELVQPLNKMDQGTLSLYDVWRQHNEHRPMFPILVMLGLARATGWNISAEIALNVVLGAAIFAVCAAALRRAWPDGPASRYGLMPLFALLMFSPDQWENWLWGWQISIFLGGLAGAAGVLLLTDPVPTRWRFAGALACGVVATYSFASGLTFWVIGAVPLWLNPQQRRAGRIASWVVVGAATIGSYFYHYHPNPGHPSMLLNFVSLRAFRNLLVYLAKYLGASVASYSVHAAAVAGAFAVVCYVALVKALWPVRRRTAFLFPATLGLYAMTSAAITGLGRAGFGSDQAMASRYTTLSAPLWVALLWLGALSLSQRSEGHESRSGRVQRGMAALVALAFVASVIMSGAAGTAAAANRHSTLRSLRTAFLRGQDERLLRQLYLNDAAAVKEHRGVLRMLRMSVFRDE
jgi:hypothetical protein